MRIFIIWITILCCSIANGFLFQHFDMPENFVFMVVPTLICGVVLWWHREMTKSWEKPLDQWDWEKYHFPIFRLTMFVAFVCMIMVIVVSTSNKVAILIGVGTELFSSFIAFHKEIDYTGEWV